MGLLGRQGFRVRSSSKVKYHGAIPEWRCMNAEARGWLREKQRGEERTSAWAVGSTRYGATMWARDQATHQTHRAEADGDDWRRGVGEARQGGPL